MLRLLLLLALLLPWSPALAQTCAQGTATDSLDAGDVTAPLFNDGGLFDTMSFNGPFYEVPRGSGLSSIKEGQLWIGGTVGGELRFAGSEGSIAEYWPGPLDPDGQTDPATCDAFDRIWTVTLADIARYNATGEATADLAQWPYEAGAPVVDGDGDPDNYDLAAGDRPELHGEQTAWWIMNDRGGPHNWGGTEPLGVEVRVWASSSSAAFLQEYGGNDDVLSTATLYRYTITNRNDQPIEEAHVGFWMEASLGRFTDNFVGCDPKLGVGYVYNRDDDDEGAEGYGANPPAVGAMWVGGPWEPLSIVCGTYTADSGPTGRPNSGADAYGYLRAVWRDGTPFTYGNTGYNSGHPVRTLYSTPPPAYWSMHDLDGFGTMPSGVNPVVFVANGPFTIAPGETVEMDLVIPWSRGDDGAISSVAELRHEAARMREIRTFPDSPFFPTPGLQTILPSELPTAGERTPEATTLTLSSAPNPARGGTSLRVTLAEPAHAAVTVTDLLGREVARLHDGPLVAGETALALSTEGWAPGVYLVRLATPSGQTTHRITVVR